MQLLESVDLVGVRIQCTGLSDEFIELGLQELPLPKFHLDAGG